MTDNLPGDLLMIRPPYLKKDGPYQPLPFNEAVGYFLQYGVNLAFGPGDALPSELPKDLSPYKGVIICFEDLSRLKDSLTGFDGIDELIGESPDRLRDGDLMIRHDDLPLLLFAPTERILSKPTAFEHFLVQAEIDLDSPDFDVRMRERSDEEIIRAQLDFSLPYERHDWSDVMCYTCTAFLDLYELTGEEKLLRRVEYLFDTAQARLPDGALLGEFQLKEFQSATSIWPLTPLTRLVKIYPKPEYDAFLRLHAASLIQKIVPVYEDSAEGRFMAGIAKAILPILSVANYAGRGEEIHDRIAEEIVLTAEKIRDPKTGVWRYFNWKGRVTPFQLGHGSLLALYHLPQILERLPRDSEAFERVSVVFCDLCEAVSRFQKPEGYWHNVMDVDLTLPSTTYTIEFGSAFLFGARFGLLGEEYRERGLAAWEFSKTKTFGGGWFGAGLRASPTMNPYFILQQGLEAKFDPWNYPSVNQLHFGPEAIVAKGKRLELELE